MAVVAALSAAQNDAASEDPNTSGSGRREVFLKKAARASSSSLGSSPRPPSRSSASRTISLASGARASTRVPAHANSASGRSAATAKPFSFFFPNASRSFDATGAANALATQHGEMDTPVGAAPPPLVAAEASPLVAASSRRAFGRIVLVVLVVARVDEGVFLLDPSRRLGGDSQRGGDALRGERR